MEIKGKRKEAFESLLKKEKNPPSDRVFYGP